MYRVDRNDFYENSKNSTVYTPSKVSQFIFSTISNHIPDNGLVVDPCVGEGSLLEPFKKNGYVTIGIDIVEQGFPKTLIKDFMEISEGEIDQPDLVVANPPFNLDKKTMEIVASRYGRRPLLPEVWLRKCLELWGGASPNCSICPIRVAPQPISYKCKVEKIHFRGIPRNLLNYCPSQRYLQRCFISQRNTHIQSSGTKSTLFLLWLVRKTLDRIRNNINPRIPIQKGVIKQFIPQCVTVSII